VQEAATHQHGKLQAIEAAQRRLQAGAGSGGWVWRG